MFKNILIILAEAVLSWILLSIVSIIPLMVYIYSFVTSDFMPTIIVSTLIFLLILFMQFILYVVLKENI